MFPNINIDSLLELIKSNSAHFIAGGSIAIAGWITASLARRLTKRALEYAGADPTITLFMSNSVYWLLLSAFMISALKQVGIHTTSFVAVLGATGLAIALSFQKALSNVANGLMLIIFRPFNVGDQVKAAGCEGKVIEINLFNTVIQASDEETVFVSNSKIAEGNISRFNKKPSP